MSNVQSHREKLQFGQTYHLREYFVNICFFSDKNIEFYDKNAKMNIPSPGRRPVDIREVSSPSLQTDQSTK